MLENVSKIEIRGPVGAQIFNFFEKVFPASDFGSKNASFSAPTKKYFGNTRKQFSDGMEWNLLGSAVLTSQSGPSLRVCRNLVNVQAA